MPLHLVLIETSGNQNYIFATNKLRENVGASELTYRAGTEWVLRAVQDAGGPPGLWAEDPTQLRRNICDKTKNLPLSEATKVEVIVATSGKALLLVTSHETGQKIIRCVTKMALELAPGIDVCGVISKPFELNKEPLGKVIRDIHDQLEEVRANRPGPALRFLRLPIVTECATSGYPASKWDQQSAGTNKAKSAVSLSKLKAAPKKDFRLDNLLANIHQNLSFASNLEELEEKCDWFAVIHADGNGLGEIFLRFGSRLDVPIPQVGEDHEKYNRCYIDKYRRFSVALDLCTEKAIQFAITRLLVRFKHHFPVPLIVPIVLGGDDLTVICDGRIGLQFTHDFLYAFEKETGSSHQIFDEDVEYDLGEIVSEIAEKALGDKRLSACAGVAIIKPHYPFSAAYDLAEELIKAAKQVKKIIKREKGKDDPWPCSALDFHALYDSTASELREIRDNKLTANDGAKLYARPYVVTEITRLALAETGAVWAKQHHWCELQERVDATLEEDDEGRRVIPNSQLHDLREGLFLGKDGANARYDLIRHRYAADKAATLETFAEKNDGRLFFLDENHRGEKFPATKFLDAMEAANFWVKEERGETECPDNQ